MRIPAPCICEDKGVDQLHGNRAADQRLCFRYMDSSIPFLSKSKISSVITVQPGLCRTWLETPKIQIGKFRPDLYEDIIGTEGIIV